MALVLLICMVVSFAPAAYADVDEAPAVQEEPTVQEETVVEESTVKEPVSEEEALVEENDAETPEQPAVPSGSNSIKELFKFHCTTDDTHADQTYNWFGSYVKYNNDMAYDAARGVWTASANITNVQTLLSTGVKAPNKVWGKTHYHTDADGNKVITATIKLVWDASASGLNASGTQTTGLWLPDGGVQTVDVWCATAPAAPTIAALPKSTKSSTAIRVQDSTVPFDPKNTRDTVSSNVHYFRDLKEGTYEFTPVTKDENGDFWCTLKITDFAPYVANFNTRNSNPTPAYRIDEELTTATFEWTLKYTGSKTNYAQDGSGWSIQSSSWAKGETSRTGKLLYVAQQYSVTYTDGVNGKAFADQVLYAKPGSATPDFVGEPTRAGYSFVGWTPEVSDTVTGDVVYTAVWKALSYKITFNGNGGKVGSAGAYTSKKTFETDSEVKLASAYDNTRGKFVKALSDDYSTNYRQIGWNTAKDGSGTHYAMNGTMTMPAGNVTLYAEWEGYEWIHWNATVGEGGESITIHEGVTGATAKTGTSFKLYTGNVGTGYGKVPAAYYTPVEATAKDGYYFVGWYDVAKDALVSAKTNLTTQDFRDLRKLTMAESGAVLEARFAKYLVVTYTDGVEDEDVFADQVYSVKPGEATPEFVGTPTRTNYDFKGWEPEVSATVTGDVTYTAKWEPSTKKMPKNITEADVNKMQIRAYAEGTESYSSINEMLSCSPRIYAKGVEYTINPVVGNDVDGYTTSVTFHFKHGDQLEAGAISVFNSERGLGYYSDWEKWTGNWSYDFDEYTGAAKNGATRPAEQTLTLKWVVTVNPRTGRETGSWKALDKNGNLAGNNTAAINNVIQVNLKLERTVTYTDGVNGVVFADQVYTIRNGSVAPAFDGTPTREGYKFAGWEPAFDATAKIYADTTYVAQWIALYTVTYTDGVDGEEIFADQSTTVEDGSKTPAFDGTPEREGYVFKGWAPAVAETVTGNVTYVAQWTALYTVTYTDGVDGEELFADQSTTVEDGSKTPAFVGTPERAGYTFAGWAPEVAETVTENVTYTAQWTANDYTLSRNSNGGDELADVTVTMGQPYGDAIVASPRAGYTEDGWFLIVDDTVIGTEIKADTEVAMPDNHRIFLKRSIAPVTVTVSEDIIKDYDGEKVTLTASTDEYTGLVYSYQWYKDGEEIKGATGKTLTLDGNVADSGVYTVKLTVTNAQDSGVVTENESVTAEAEVKVVINKINNSLTYNYNGADEEDSTVETIESAITVDADKEITRKGYDFLGWNTKADGTGDSYKSGDELTFVDNGNGGEAVTLYAQWKGKEYKLTFKIKEDPDFKEDVKLNFTSKTVVYGEKVGQFPYATRKDHILVWYDKDGKRVNSETVYLVEGDSTYTGVWTEYKPVVATGDSSNIALYAAAMFASIACIGAGIILLRRKREE